jgi:hypothetical protein
MNGSKDILVLYLFNLLIIIYINYSLIVHERNKLQFDEMKLYREEVNKKKRGFINYNIDD